MQILDFIIRDSVGVVPIEVKVNDNRAIFLINVITDNKYNEVKYGIKFCNKNIGFNEKYYIFPYFMAFFLKRYIKENK